MKRLLLGILFLLCIAPAADSVTVVVGQCVPSCTGYLLCQNFENTGYDNFESWAEETSNATLSEDDTTATVLRGSQQLKMAVTSSGGYADTSSQFTASDTVYIHFLYKRSDIPTGDVLDTKYDNIFLVRNYANNSTQAWIAVRTNGTILAKCGTVTAVSTSTISVNTAYHIWLRYTKGTGANAIFTVYIGTSTSRPETADISITKGTSTQQAGTAYLLTQLNGTTSTTTETFYDQIIVDDSDFSTVDE